MSEKEEKKETTPKKKTTKKTETKVKKGSLVYVDYVGRIKEDNEIFDLTIEEVAKKEGVYNERGRYEPMLVAVGHNWLLEAIEEELEGMKVGESKHIEIPPERAAGPRDPSKIKLFPKTKILKMGIRPIKGERVKIGNDEGIITLVTGRKVRIDFNSRLAGKTLVFDVTVKGIVSDTKEKIMAIVKRRIPGIPEEMFKVSKSKGVVTVEMPELTRYIEGVQYAEIGLASDIVKIMDDVNEVKLVVVYKRKEETPPAAE
ncbi:MAG: FKBP-type peptidyl-prolyl cis-trans isomerase [Candidatus Thorarchaeota archaeon]